MREQLRHRICQAGKKQAEARQIARRYRELLSLRLARLAGEYRRSFAAGKAERLALHDPRYLRWLDELTELSFEALKARVEWETGRMRWDALQSQGVRKQPPF